MELYLPFDFSTSDMYDSTFFKTGDLSRILDAVDDDFFSSLGIAWSDWYGEYASNVVLGFEYAFKESKLFLHD